MSGPAAWCWNHIGVSWQLWVWRWAEPVAIYCETAANRRDEVGS